MSKIPYHFDTPVPQYFRKHGWMQNYKNSAFISWAFSRCRTEIHKVYHDHKEITLQPFEFICGRRSASEETGLTEKEIRGQLISLENLGYLKKTANSKANRYSCYIWFTERFQENEGQQKGQPRANRGPTEGHKSDHRSKKDIDDDDDRIIPLRVKDKPSAQEKTIQELITHGYERQEIDVALNKKSKYDVSDSGLKTYLMKIMDNNRSKEDAIRKHKPAVKRNSGTRKQSALPKQDDWLGDATTYSPYS